jgi:hypothetical protein
MAITIKHAKTDSIADWTQADLDAQIAAGNFPPGTLLANIVLPSDWNNDHTVSGTIAIANGGTGQTTANAAINALLPSQTGNSGKVLSTNGTDTSWLAVSGSGTVTSVTGTAPVSVATGTTTPVISMAAANTTTNGYLTSTDWNTFNGKQNAFGSQTANYVYAAPDGTAGTPTFRALVSNDIPSLSGTYVPYTGATAAVDLNAKSLTNISSLGINTTTVPTIKFRAFGDNGSTSRIAMRGYSADANSSAIRVTKFRGTYAAPQAPQSGDSLGKFELAGYGTTSSDGYAQASFEGVATEAWGATARGTKTLIKVTPNTTTTQATAVTIDQDKSVTLAGALNVTGTTTLATALSGLAKLTSGVVSTATSGTDYAPATSGSSILYGNGSGGFSNVTIGTGVSFAGGTLSATGSGGTVTSVTGTAPVVSSGGATPAISMPAATTSVSGYLTSTDWTTFNNKGSGTVTSVAVTAPSIFSVAGSPITSSGTIALTYSGTALPILNGGTGQTTASAAFNALSPLTTSGDILYGATSGAGTRLGIGTAGQVLTVSVGGLPSWTTIGLGTGTVTSVSVVSANGFAGTVATATTTPAITISTSITGVLKGNGTAVSAATSGTDYSAGTSALTTGILKSTTTTGALSIAVAADFPTLNQNTTGTAANVTGTVAVANGGTGQTSYTNGQLLIGNTTGNTLAKATLTAGTGISVTNGTGSITIANSAPSISWQAVQTTNFTATAGNGYPVNTTSGAITVTLPASPTAGDAITFTDYASKWATNNVTLNINGNKLNSSVSNAILSTNRQSISLVYIDATQGWIAYSGFLDSIPSQTYTASYLVVAGGGGSGIGVSGASLGGGAGAGGYLTNTMTFTVGTVYTATVGGGGASTANGSNSTFPSVTTVVGGGAGGTFPAVGGSGGSGGGGSGNPGSTAGSGTPGQGNAGGGGAAANNAGGGGGAGAAGGAATSPATGGNGGIGLASSITGSSTYYAGGGGGSATVSGSGGTGGGGAGVLGPATPGNAGAANTGGGAGGVYLGTGAAGGSGVIILSVPTTNYSGTTTGSPTITTSGANTIIKFTASGSYTA